MWLLPECWQIDGLGLNSCLAVFCGFSDIPGIFLGLSSVYWHLLFHLMVIQKTRGSLRLYSNIEIKDLVGESQLVSCQSSLLDEVRNAAKDGGITAEREEFLISSTVWLFQWSTCQTTLKTHSWSLLICGHCRNYFRWGFLCVSIHTVTSAQLKLTSEELCVQP